MNGAVQNNLKSALEIKKRDDFKARRRDDAQRICASRRSNAEIARFFISLWARELRQSLSLLRSSRIVSLIRFAPRALNIALVRNAKKILNCFAQPTTGFFL